jgi:hypothetical protein
MTGLNWFWIGLQLTLPPVGGWFMAWLFWRIDQPIFGNLAGSVVLFGSAFALMMREHAEIDRTVRQCLDQGFHVLAATERLHAVGDLRLDWHVGSDCALRMQPERRSDTATSWI